MSRTIPLLFLASAALLVRGFQPRATVPTTPEDFTVLARSSSQSGLSERRALVRRAGRRWDGEKDADGVPMDKVKAPRPTRSDIKSKWGGTKIKRRSNQGKALEQGMTNPSRLTIAGGRAKGRRLDSPEVQLRPMMGKVKEALFSTLTGFGVFDRPNIRHLDLFAGSGSVGLESLSRGAHHATFVDFAPECCAVAAKNAAWCGFDWEGAHGSVCASVLDVLADPAAFGLDAPYDVVTVTPPYEEVSYSELVSLLVSSPLVFEDTVVVLEYPIEMGSLPPVLGNRRLLGVRNRRYGRTVLGVYVCRPSGKWNLDLRSEEFVDANLKKGGK